MKLLVLGPGMIGTLLAAKLAKAGHEISVLGRGRRLAEVRQRGLRVRKQGGEHIDTVEVDCVEALGDDAYDWILVTVHGNQVTSLLDSLSAHRATPNVMILTNHAGDVDGWVQAVGADRLTLGFPGITAFFDDEGVLDYQFAPRVFQPTTLGELDGRKSARLEQLVVALENAGVPAAIEADMKSWLRYHVAWISVLGLMAAAAGRSAETLAADPSIRRSGVDAIREGFAVLAALGYQMTPGALRAFVWTPRWLVAALIKQMLKDPIAAKFVGEPTAAMELEARHMVSQMKALSKTAGIPMPVYESLAQHLDAEMSGAPTGAP